MEKPQYVIDSETKYVSLVETPAGQRMLCRPGTVHDQVELLAKVKECLLPGTTVDMSILAVPRALLELPRQNPVAIYLRMMKFLKLVRLDRLHLAEAKATVKFLTMVDFGGLLRKVSGPARSFAEQSQITLAVVSDIPDGVPWKVCLTLEHQVDELESVDRQVVHEDGVVLWFVEQHAATDMWYLTVGRHLMVQVLDDHRRQLDLTAEQTDRLRKILLSLHIKVLAKMEMVSAFKKLDRDVELPKSTSHSIAVRLQELLRRVELQDRRLKGLLVDHDQRALLLPPPTSFDTY